MTTETPTSFQEIRDQLKTTIKGRALSSRGMRREANQTSGMAKHDIHLRMRSYGAATRNYLLAYAFLRGIPYKVAEQSCRPDNPPRARAISSVLEDLDEAFEGNAEIPYGEQAVRDWINAKSEDLQQAA